MMRLRLLLAMMLGLMMLAPYWAHAQTACPPGMKANGAGACGYSQRQPAQQGPTDASIDGIRRIIADTRWWGVGETLATLHLDQGSAPMVWERQKQAGSCPMSFGCYTIKWESPDPASGIQAVLIDYYPSSSIPPTVDEDISVIFNADSCLTADELAQNLSARLDEIPYPGRAEPWNPNPPERREPVLFAANKKGEPILLDYTLDRGTRSKCVTSVKLHLFLEKRYVDAPPS